MNYVDTFIEIADYCPAQTVSVPASKGGKKTIPVLQYEMIANHPYKYTQEDVLFETYAEYNEIPLANWPMERHKFFSKGQPCLRSSSLGKRYGWGIHSDTNGKVTLYAMESEYYQRFAGDPTLKHLKAMRSKRA
jgi:uncharacterized protein DUF6157